MIRITILTILGYFIFSCSFGQNIGKADANPDEKLVAILDTIYVEVGLGKFQDRYMGILNYTLKQ